MADSYHPMTTNTHDIYRPLNAEDVHALKFIAISEALDLALYGTQTALSTVALVILGRRRGRSRFTLAAVLGLLLASTISIAIRMSFWLIQFPFAFGTSTRSVAAVIWRLNILVSLLHNFNYVLSDAVLVWRAWCLWPANRLAHGVLSVCLIGSIAGSIAECVWDFWPDHFVHGYFESSVQLLTMLIPLLITNAVATLLIGAKFLYYRREIKGSLGLLSQKSQAEKVLILLFESGVLVDCIVPAVIVDSPTNDYRIFSHIYYHIAGIYPTCVLFVAIQGTSESLLSGPVSQAMRFAGGPATQEEREMATLDSQSEPTDNACLDVPLDSPHAMNLPRPPRAQIDAEPPQSSEGIVTVEREPTTM